MIAANDDIRIERWCDCPNRDGLAADLDRIFFTSSGTQTFESHEQRAAFRERWLGRYLTHHPDWTFVAVSPDGQCVGYVIGSPDDPAQTARFDDIGYFKSIGHVTARYPAQLHVNVLAEYRGTGLGSRLVAAFADQAKAQGLPGVHIVTGLGMRNAEFYARNGFCDVGRIKYNERELLIMGLALAR